MTGHKPKISNSVLGIISIFAIFLIVFIALNFTPTSSTTYDMDSIDDRSGYVTQAVIQDDATSMSVPICKMVIGLSTVYDSMVLGAMLEEGASATYFGKTVTVISMNADGCVVDVEGESEYLAVGQIQRVGYLYITVTDVSN